MNPKRPLLNRYCSCGDCLYCVCLNAGSPEREYALGPIHWLVGRHHVSEPDFTIARDIARRTTGWPRAQQRVLAIRDAIAAHHDNRALYLEVMR